MTRTRTSVLIAVLADAVPERGWLYESNLSQRLFARLSKAGKPKWFAHEPSERYPRRLHRHFVPVGLRQEMKEAILAPIREMRASLDNAWRLAMIAATGQEPAPYENTVAQIAVMADEEGVDYLAIVFDNHVAVFPEAITVAVQAAVSADADFLYCRQLEGVFPSVVSRRILNRWLEHDRGPNPALLSTPKALSSHGKVIEYKPLDNEVVDGPIRCCPINRRETKLFAYWESRAERLKSAMSLMCEGDEKGSEELLKIMQIFRAEQASALESYRVVGTLHDIDDLRQRMLATSKPVTDYFVIATHYVRFLQRYAGLNQDSHVVDIGCSWGYLAFALANYLTDAGGYLGIEVQEEPITWARQHLAWLGGNFEFEHVDLKNDYYNPEGDEPRGAVRLPIQDGWANSILAGSVFTHMQEDGVQSYLEEFRRILAPGGIAAFSYDDSTFWADSEEYVIEDQRVPDLMTIYSRDKINQMAAKAGLHNAREPVNMSQFDRTDYQTWYFATPI